MKKRLLTFAFLPFLSLLNTSVQAQSSSDTFTLHVLTQFWKTGQPTKDFSFSVPNLPLFFPPGIVGVNTAADSSTIIVQYIPDILDDDFCVSEGKDGDHTNGVNVGDLVAISKHVLGVQPLSGFAKFAADGNKSNSVTTFDIVELRKLILGIYQELPNNQSWYVLPENFFSDFNSCQKIPQMPQQQTDSIRFVSVKIGDVDGDANPAGPYQLPQTSGLMLGVPNTTVQAGQTVWLPISVAQDVTLSGIQFGIKFDPAVLELKDTKSQVINWTLDNFGIFQGAVTCLGTTSLVQPLNFPASSALIEIQVKALQGFSPQQAIAISNEKTPGLWVDADMVLHPIDTTLAALSAQVETVWAGLEIGAAQPNPFTEQTNIPLVLGKSAVVFLELSDMSGKLLRQQTFDLPAGRHSLDISGGGIPANNLLFYRVWADNWSHSGKILRR